MAAVCLFSWFMPAAEGDVPTLTSKVQIDNLIPSTPKHDYDAEVLTPLHQKQADKQKADQLAAEQAAARLAEQQQLERVRVVQVAQAVVQVTGDCQSWMSEAGITDVADATWLIMHESGCRPNAVNPGSGACGIGQQLPCGKWPHQWNDPVGAMIDTQNYVVSRYGSWANAVAWWQAHNWY